MEDIGLKLKIGEYVSSRSRALSLPAKHQSPQVSGGSKFTDEEGSLQVSSPNVRQRVPPYGGNSHDAHPSTNAYAATSSSPTGDEQWFSIAKDAADMALLINDDDDVAWAALSQRIKLAQAAYHSSKQKTQYSSVGASAAPTSAGSLESLRQHLLPVQGSDRLQNSSEQPLDYSDKVALEHHPYPGVSPSNDLVLAEKPVNFPPNRSDTLPDAEDIWLALAADADSALAANVDDDAFWEGLRQKINSVASQLNGNSRKDEGNS